MALRVPCPNCGPRPHSEFVFGGEERPIASADAEADFVRIFMPRNPAGPTRERWFHALGCRTWLTVVRDTTTDAIGPG